MVTYPRQRLYDTNHAGFVRAALARTLDAPTGADFVGAFSAFTGTSDVLPLARGRLGFYLGVKEAIRRGRGRKVILSAFTIFDLVNVVIAAGGIPTFVDSQPASPHIPAESIAAALDDETCAVLITHYHTSYPEIRKLAAICAARGVLLIEDCAISLGARIDGQHVGTFGDVGVFSFGLFKFISTYFGGGVVFKDPAARTRAAAEVEQWPPMTFSDMKDYFAKGVRFSLLTSDPMFRLLTFPVLKYGFVHDIEAIKAQAKNDPNPVLRTELPESYKRRPNAFQLSEWARQLPNVEPDKAARVKRAGIYAEILGGSNSVIGPQWNEAGADCFLNYPVLVDGDRDRFVKQIMKAGFDCSVYYYRNCAEVEAFRDYRVNLPNLNRFVRQVIVLPTYPSLPEDYVARFARFVRDEAARMPAAQAA